MALNWFAHIVLKRKFVEKGNVMLAHWENLVGYFCPEQQQCHPAVPLSQTMTHGHAPTPHNILSSTCFFFVFFVFDFISCLLQTVTHDQAPEPHNILSHAQPFFGGIFMFYTLSHSLQTWTHDQAPTAQSSFSSKKQKFCAFMFCYICCRQLYIGACLQAP